MRLVSSSEASRVASPAPREHLPLVVFPRGGGAGAAGWATPLRSCADRYLTQQGCILFRGFPLCGEGEFRAFVSAFGSEPDTSSDPWSARGIERSGGGAAEEPLPLIRHALGEALSPQRWLFCERGPRGGVESLLTDHRDAYRALPSALRELFARRGLRYARNFGSDASWAAAFGTHDRAHVEAWCRAHATRCEWRADGGLRIQRSGPAVRRHPLTHELLWPEAAHLVRECSPGASVKGLPVGAADDETVHIYYEDGAPLEEHALEQLRGALDAATSLLHWEEGDVLLLDDLLVTHAASRPRRRLVAACGWAD